MGRDEGFDEFYAEQIRPLRRLGFLLTGDWAEAEELAQDAMERTYRAWRRIGDAPGAYARTVLTNRHRSILRRAVVEAKHVVIHREAQHPGDLSEERIMLWSAVSRLPVRHRQAIVLRFYEDRSDEEIAEILGCAVATVRSLVHRGLARLRASAGGGTATVGSEVA